MNGYFVFDVEAKEALSGKVLIIALYGETGEMLELINVPQTRAITSAYIVTRANAGAKTAKVLLWNELVNAVPDAPCETVELN